MPLQSKILSSTANGAAIDLPGGLLIDSLVYLGGRRLFLTVKMGIKQEVSWDTLDGNVFIFKQYNNSAEQLTITGYAGTEDFIIYFWDKQ